MATQLSEVLDLRERNPLPRWEVHHEECDPAKDRDDYWMAIERVRTPQTLLGWTLHFVETKDFADTSNWTDFMRKIMSQNGIKIEG